VFLGKGDRVATVIAASVTGARVSALAAQPCAGRHLPIGAEVVPGGVHFRVWAPRRRTVSVVTEGAGSSARFPLIPSGDGYFEGLLADAGAGLEHRYRLDEDDYLYPDPAARFQPRGPHGPSEVIDPTGFPWSDALWRGASMAGQVIYEMHVGTFTMEGTWAAAEMVLPQLQDLGVTVIEIMPVAEFPGRFGWGYDGVDLFAPTRLYGRPDDFRRFVDRAHALGVAVILDVVYNHLGPSGNYLAQFAEEYFTTRYVNDWGAAVNFDGPGSHGVRELVVSNAAYWIDEFHLDGLRFDATQSIHDSSPVHVITVAGRAAREAAGERGILLVAENEPQLTRLVRPEEAGGMGLDALWNDDFHHTARVALTGRREAYYTDYHGSPQELISALKWGYLYQGQRYSWQKKRRGTAGLGLPAPAFVLYIQNHDQIANSATGQRLHELTTPGRHRAMTALTLLAPGTPMLFQGQEFAASAPFLYFADHEPDLAKLVADGRREFLRQFPSMSGQAVQGQLAAPDALATFQACRLDHAERTSGMHAATLAMHRDLLRLRREEPVFLAQDARSLHGAVLGPEAFLLRWIGANDDDRLLIVNLGPDRVLHEAPEPLLAPPDGHGWATMWSSEDVKYGGLGVTDVDRPQGWHLPGHAAVLLRPGESRPEAGS
jgi:maltooligosyltrehalose trehalohydrolase